jgi:hypothetical protein
MLPEIADRMIQLIRTDNPRVERSAYLMPAAGATLHLQFQRLVKEAAHPARRIFTDVGAMRGWLDAVLAPAERERLASFLGVQA